MAQFSDPAGNFNPYEPPSAMADGAPVKDPDDEWMLLPAERGTRWWARFVDNFLLGITFVPGIFLADFGTRGDAPGPGFLLMFILPFFLLLYQWYLVTTRGQTIAKRWMNIKIVRLDGSDVGFVNGVILRGWVMLMIQLIPYVGSIMGLVDAVMIFGDERRCLHDHIAGTKVVLALRTS
jgi:uncharacterized RDD family membrane protein YckC